MGKHLSAMTVMLARSGSDGVVSTRVHQGAAIIEDGRVREAIGLHALETLDKNASEGWGVLGYGAHPIPDTLIDAYAREQLGLVSQSERQPVHPTQTPHTDTLIHHVEIGTGPLRMSRVLASFADLGHAQRYAQGLADSAAEIPHAKGEVRIVSYRRTRATHGEDFKPDVQVIAPKPKRPNSVKLPRPKRGRPRKTPLDPSPNATVEAEAQALKTGDNA